MQAIPIDSCILHIILIQEFQFYKVHVNRFTFQAFLFQRHCWDPGSDRFNLLLQEIQFYKSTSSSGNSFIHSTLLRAPIGKEFRFYFKNIQLVIHHLYAPHQIKDSQNYQGHSFRTRILCGRSNKLLENKFYIVYIDYGLIQVSFLQTAT